MGKVLATDVRTVFADKVKGSQPDLSKMNEASRYLLE